MPPKLPPLLDHPSSVPSSAQSPPSSSNSPAVVMMKNQIAPEVMERPGDEKNQLIGANKAEVTASPGKHHAEGGKKGCIQMAGELVSGGIHSLFYGLGAFVARRPWITIFVCLAITGLCGAVRATK